jgi:hypothetical protein
VRRRERGRAKNGWLVSLVKIPDDAVSHWPTVATLAVLRGARSVEDVARAMGPTVSKSSAHAALLRAREAGLVDWENGLSGTLRPACAVAHGS